ncbi:MAG: RagB/SusD family nutrient uptake outer membrane protein [Prevotella sp.]|nr:RagB/SusD family nutrient uptake outer membrane protein [Prevotella sp.]
MKKIYKSIFGAGLVALSVASLTSCIDETEPTTVATTDQIAESSSAAEALMMAMPAYFNEAASYEDWIDDGSHFPFGYGAIMFIRDLMTGDLGFNQSRYAGHFSAWAQNKDMGDSYLKTQYLWRYYYGFVLAANNTVGGVNAETATDQQLGYLGAGLAFRSLLYLDLARMYEFLPNDKTSSINKDGNDVLNLTVPIVKAEMNQADAANNPRATREDMKTFIEDDLNKAEEYIVNLKDTRGNVLPDLACVYGLKARLYMWVEDYAKAQEYARKAIDASKVKPLTRERALSTINGYNTASDFMWASQQTTEDYTVNTGIINWTSWLSNQTTFGYTGLSTTLYSVMDANMYKRIGDNDWRKLEFVAPAGSALEGQNIFIDEELGEAMPAYASIKFRPNNGNIEDYAEGAASAYPIMRVEEMYFIEAEAAAHQNAGQGKALVEDFMKNYRDANYTCKVTDTNDVVEEIVFQKRVELWGEGQTFFDIKRLNYSVTRGYPGTPFFDLTRLNTNGRPAWMNLVIVRTESNNNTAVDRWNNPDPTDAYDPWTEE